MELAISALTGELVSRFVSFLTNKYHSSRAYSKENQLERLQQLLLRVGMVIEEADSRYIVNSCMLIQLKMLAAAMYRGHHVLDTIRSMKHREFLEKQVWDSSTLSVSTPYKRSRTVGSSIATNMVTINSELQSALQNLEAGVANMVEFVVLLSGYERISRRPYDAYLYIDNFMFGRHVEKQKILMFLLEYDSPGRPVVLPVIGGNGVGKKTLIAHVCDNERVRSHFSMVLHLNGDDLFRITDHEWMSGKTLVVIEFVSDVDEDDWATFHRSITNMDRGSKVIILGRNAGLEKFGTVKPISLSCLSLEEYSYLFKTLAFGSADQTDHPRLAAMVEKFATVLGGSLISANVLADALRKNLSAHFWLSLLNGARDSVKKNNTRFGAHPQELFSRGHPVHLIGGYILSPATPSRIVKSANSMTSIPEEGLPRIMFGDLIAREGHVVLPRGDFRLISWESRLPPYTSFVHLVRSASSCVNDKPKTPLSGKKRPSLFG
ncbi:disease resistance protein RGA2 isoform X1 [Lolium perenne]|jgi:hypothetical protein|uniref:disease resistance protein RGA2 isoform X1 n=1 Tax=Lolium perenne TaxID=4522 RepID=UPI0021EA725A|nr:disease resistance protein RGA2-like isoform X1 [Lolium perenne]